MPRDLLDTVAISIPRSEIHFSIILRRIEAQRLFDYAHFLDEFPPVGRSKETQTHDGVADRDLIRGLGLAFDSNAFLDREPFAGELLLDPIPGEVDCRVETWQALTKLRDEGARQWQFRLSHLREDHDEI